jgi:hypothetical protein
VTGVAFGQLSDGRSLLVSCGDDALVRVELFSLDGSRATLHLSIAPSRGLAITCGADTIFVAATDGVIALSAVTASLHN